MRAQTIKKRHRVGIVILLFLAFGIVYACFIEPYSIEVKHIQFYSEKLSPDYTGLKIVHISDLHIQEWSRLYSKAIRCINDQQADVIVITGDLLRIHKLLRNPGSKKTSESLGNILRFLNELHSRYGVFIVRGNAEFTEHKELSDLFLDTIESASFEVLANEHIRIPIAGTRIYLLGADFNFCNHYRVADFKTADIDGQKVYRSGPCIHNAYSHWIGPGCGDWKDYELSGKLMLMRPENSGIGVTFYARMFAGYDKFYRLRCSPAEPSFQFSPHSTSVYGHLDTGMKPQAGQWYRFRIQVESLLDRTSMRAKIWPESEPEPIDWQADASDTSTNRIPAGTIGLWSAKRNQHYFDDLKVTSLKNGTILFSENFDGFTSENDPSGWADFGLYTDNIRAANYGLADSVYKILLFHSPDGIVEAERLGIDLMLAGHTHGGQIRIPLLSKFKTRTKITQPFISGLYRVNQTSLYINRGLGTVLLPARFRARPEITIIRILPLIKTSLQSARAIKN